MNADEAIEMIFSENADYVVKITKAVDELLDLAKSKGFSNVVALSIFGACVTNIIQDAPSQGAALRAAAGFATAMFGSLGVEIDFAVIAEAAKVDASQFN